MNDKDNQIEDLRTKNQTLKQQLEDLINQEIELNILDETPIVLVPLVLAAETDIKSEKSKDNDFEFTTSRKNDVLEVKVKE